jgi:hypothetical protein
VIENKKDKLVKAEGKFALEKGISKNKIHLLNGIKCILIVLKIGFLRFKKRFV